MSTEVKVPALGESITEAIVMEWLVAVGEQVEADQDLVVLETDKITVNVPAPVGGVLKAHKAQPDDEVEIGTIIAIIDENGEASAPSSSDDEDAGGDDAASGDEGSGDAEAADEKKADGDKGDKAKVPRTSEVPDADQGEAPAVMPAVRRLLPEHGLAAEDIEGTGRGGRILKEDVLRHIEGAKATPATKPVPKAAKAVRTTEPATTTGGGQGGEEVVKMTKLRRTIAERLVEAQQTAAILTTFNEVDMSAVMALRNQYKDSFQKKHGVKLGFMSFFAKAAIEALKAFPAVNGEIRGDSIVYKNYYNIGVAVGGGRGLVVPVVRDADRLSFAGFEETLNTLAERARDNQLTLDDMTGGTFTISNGGVYGSLLSTPILNAPQVAILGLHKIEERPIALDGQVVIRPMMYLALSYDHRIIDGKEAVSFLVKIKECLEDPSRILLEV